MRRPVCLNALKHGLRSGSVLLPGDDVADFRRMRHRLFRLHQPRTFAEARCVETLAANEWRIARCRLEQAFFKRHLGVAMCGHPDAGGYLCSPDLHRLHHRGTDCNKEERRLEKSKSQAEAALTLLQKQRTQNLTVGGASVLEDYEVFLEEGEPVEEEEEAQVEAPAVATAEDGERNSGDDGVAPTESMAGRDSPPSRISNVTGSGDGGNGKNPKRESGAPVPSFPKRWNRRQRRAAARRRAAG